MCVVRGVDECVRAVCIGETPSPVATGLKTERATQVLSLLLNKTTSQLSLKNIKLLLLILSLLLSLSCYRYILKTCNVVGTTIVYNV